MLCPASFIFSMLDRVSVAPWFIRKVARFSKGCSASHSELITRNELAKWEDGIKIGGKQCSNRVYPGTVPLLTSTEGNLQQLLNEFSKTFENFGESCNVKTEVMVIGRNTSRMA